MAQQVDLLAVLATGKVYDTDPWKVPRPGWMTRAATTRREVSSKAEVAAFFGAVVDE